jgi:hypothetical protein
LRGDVQELITSGGPDNVAAIRVETITSGDFSFRAHLAPAPDTGAAERYLLDAVSLAPADLQRKMVGLAGRLAHHPRDVQAVRSQLQQIAVKTMAGDFRTLLDAALANL